MDVLNFAISLFIFLIVVYLYKNKSSFGNKKSKFGETVYIATMKGCPHCKPIIEMKNKGAFNMEQNVVMLDAEKNQKEINDLSKKGIVIEGYPTIVTESNKVFEGPREEAKIKEFIRQNK